VRENTLIIIVPEELSRFKDYLEADVTQWLIDNAKAFERD